MTRELVQEFREANDGGIIAGYRNNVKFILHFFH